MLDKILNAEVNWKTLTNSDIDKLKLTTPQGAKAVSQALGIPISKALTTVDARSTLRQGLIQYETQWVKDLKDTKVNVSAGQKKAGIIEVMANAETGEKNGFLKTEADYRQWARSLGINSVIDTLAKYYNVKYNDTHKYQLLQSYVRSVESGRMSPLSHFDLYEKYYNRIQNEIVGMTVGDVTITGQTAHFLERVFGTMDDPKTGFSRSGVSLEELRDCIENPVNVLPARKDICGRRSFVVVGHTAKVSINADTGVLIQTNPWRE